MKVKVTKDKRNKDSPWVVRWSNEPDPISGKQKWHQRSFRYKAEAERFKAELKTGIAEEAEQSNSTHDVTVSEFRRQWLETKGRQLGISTVELYYNTFDRLVDFFGAHRPLRDITPQKAEEFIIQQKHRSKTRRGEELAQSTRNQITRNCKALFNKAVRWKYVKANPFEEIETPEVEQQRFHRFTPEQENALRVAAPTLRHKVLYDVLLTTGARMNEVLSRTWADIDFVNGVMIISNRRCTDALPPFKIKTKRQRVVPLSPGTIDLLTQLQAESPEKVPYLFLTQKRYERVKKRWQAIGKKDGLWKNRWLVINVLRDFKSHCYRAGIKAVDKLTVHGLRKNAGQNLADAGLPVNVVQAILGHSSSETTLRYYSQVDPYHYKQVTKAVENRRSKYSKRRKGKSKKYVSGTYGSIQGESERTG